VAAPQPQFGLLELTELLTIGEVEVRSKMKRSWIYQLIKLRKFPAPIHLGGSKWIAAEVEEYVQRRIEERDRQHGENNFVPRAQILQFQPTGHRNAPPSMAGVVDSATANESTLRVVHPTLCDALRTLRIDIP
jgi:predicted DNA-binding transcriptional regulator AlpA